MTSHISKISGLFAVLVLLALGAADVARGADGMAERYRMQRYYECCYGPSHYGPNGYVHRMNWWRNAYCDGANCDERQLLCCCKTCLVPGSKPPSQCLDICLYHVIFPDESLVLEPARRHFVSGLRIEVANMCPEERLGVFRRKRRHRACRTPQPI